ncbi:MAG: aspartyl/asparaginyl beta-hydroxylase domain-containing protein, partial [Chloroflexi bacterium]|nr:aspartyl/asparaginyl beta-hydroxylase domain-containing protein [Chloroflexota bacterium]
QEYLGITAELVDWHERKLYDQGWKVFGLFDFPGGAPLPENTRKCPVTASLVERHIPRHGAAGFSVLRPRTRIRPHQGYQGDFLRCHLGLRIPAGDCGLRVGDETRSWETGKAVIFDDRLDHEAWNLTDEERVVLLIDFAGGRGRAAAGRAPGPGQQPEGPPRVRGTTW